MKKNKGNMKKAIIIILVIVLLGGGIFTYFYFQNKSADTNTDTKDNASVETQIQNTETGESRDVSAGGVTATNYLEAIRGKLAMDCRVIDPTAGEMLIKTTTGFSKMRSQMVEEGRMVNSLMIDDTAYTWNEGETTGTKMTVTPEFMTQTQEIAEDYYSEDGDATTVDCTTPTGLDFDIPSNVTFTDMSQMLQDLGIDMSQMGL